MTLHLVTQWEHRQAARAATLWWQGKNTQQIARLLAGKSESWVWNRLDLIKRLAGEPQK